MRLTKVVLVLYVLLATGATAVVGQRDIVAPADNLVVEGVPPIPMALAEEINRYTEFRYGALSNWHPTRREMLISTRFANTSQIHLLKFPAGARTQLTFFKDSTGGASYQPTIGDYFIFNKGVGGNENYQKYRYDFATGAITLLTDGKSRNTGGAWSNSGDTYVYESTRRNGEDLDIWTVNPRDPKSERMLAQLKGGGWGVYEFSPNDKQLLVGEFISANESYLWLTDATTGNQTLITPKGGAEKVLYGSAQFSKDGKGIFAITDRDSEFQRLAYMIWRQRNMSS